jgi:hypothetical protein
MVPLAVPQFVCIVNQLPRKEGCWEARWEPSWETTWEGRFLGNQEIHELAQVWLTVNLVLDNYPHYVS